MNENLEKKKSDIENAIHSFEKKTKTELVVAICLRSDPYPAASYRSAIILGFSSLVFFSLFYKIHEPIILILVQLILVLSFYFLTPILKIEKLFSSKLELERETFEKAKEVFLEFHSKGNTERAILFFLSLWERKIHLLVGSDLKEHLSREELDQVIKEMLPAFKDDQFGNGILNGIKILEMTVKDEFIPKNSDVSPSRFANHIHFVD